MVESWDHTCLHFKDEEARELVQEALGPREQSQAGVEAALPSEGHLLRPPTPISSPWEPLATSQGSDGLERGKRLEGEPLSPKKEVLKCFLEIAGFSNSPSSFGSLEPTGSPGEGVGRVVQGPLLSPITDPCPPDTHTATTTQVTLKTRN